MNASEEVFCRYLDQHSLQYEQDYLVGSETNPTNVDFYIKSGDFSLYADVKAVISSGATGGPDADRNIRKDVRRLRSKFKCIPTVPVVLVTINYSPRFFTGLTVAKALLGEIGLYFDTNGRSPMQHLSRGDAVLTKEHNRIISAVLGFDRVNQKHYLFENPFAHHRVPSSFFPGVRVVPLDREAAEFELVELSRIMFWEA
jgi:hypothetical protein